MKTIYKKFFYKEELELKKGETHKIKNFLVIDGYGDKHTITIEYVESNRFWAVITILDNQMSSIMQKYMDCGLEEDIPAYIGYSIDDMGSYVEIEIFNLVTRLEICAETGVMIQKIK